MPILVLSNGRGVFIKLITAICLYLGMFTTLISCVFVFTNYINSYIKNYKHSTMLSLLLGFISSLFGFDAIIGYAYIIIAIIGITIPKIRGTLLDSFPVTLIPPNFDPLYVLGTITFSML